jgi:hypothetical protein
MNVYRMKTIMVKLSAIVLFGMALLTESVLQAQVYSVQVATEYPVVGGQWNTALFKLLSVTTSTPDEPMADEWAGPLTLSATLSGATKTYESYCIGLYETVSPGTAYSGGPRPITYPFPSSQEPPSGVGHPGSMYADATRRAAVVFIENRAAASESLYLGAALQTAIWESMYLGFAYTGVNDQTHTLSSTEVTAFDAQVHDYLGALNNNNIWDSKYDGAAYQWVVHATPGDVTQYLITVPEPTETIAAGLLVIAVLAGLELRKKARKV